MLRSVTVEFIHGLIVLLTAAEDEQHDRTDKEERDAADDPRQRVEGAAGLNERGECGEDCLKRGLHGDTVPSTSDSPGERHRFLTWSGIFFVISARRATALNYACRMDFADSGRSTLGIEWELAVVDASSGELAGFGPQIVAAIDDPRIVTEYMTNTVELVTGVHTCIPEAVAELAELRELLRQATAQRGLAFIGSGSHPTSSWRDATIRDTERFTTMREESKAWADRLAIWGLHTHIGVESRAKVAPVMHVLTATSPVLLAASASSPFWCREDTGFASHRTMLFQQLPHAGTPPAFRSWAEIEEMVDHYIASGIIQSATELRWEIRPTPRFGTIEVRVADGATSLDDLAALTAFTHAIAEATSRALDRGTRMPALCELPLWAHKTNRWRAARYGTGMEVIQYVGSSGTPLARVADELIEWAMPAAASLGCVAELERFSGLVRENSADRQRARLAASAGRFEPLLQELIAAARG